MSDREQLRAECVRLAIQAGAGDPVTLARQFFDFIVDEQAKTPAYALNLTVAETNARIVDAVKRALSPMRPQMERGDLV